MAPGRLSNAHLGMHPDLSDGGLGRTQDNEGQESTQTDRPSCSLQPCDGRPQFLHSLSGKCRTTQLKTKKNCNLGGTKMNVLYDF